MSASESFSSRCSRCGAVIEKGGCLRCLLEEASQVAPIGRRPLWEESDEVDNCLEIIDEFALLESLGKGGMGEVFLARQLITGRKVALKLLGPHVTRARVDREATALATLSHPNIVGILHRGEHQGRTYLVMDYVEGRNLADELRAVPISVQEVARILSSTAKAVAHAHGRGVLHRDLKPHNILLDPQGEPHVTDFGLAQLENEPALTASHTILGTPGYAAPEQLESSIGPISPKTDVYGLGATFYYLLTGTAPFRGDTLEQTYHRVLNSEPVAPSRINAAVETDLEVICLGCLEKDPSRRYGSARELAAELDRWLQGEPILRRPAGRLELAVRWCRRHPSLAILSMATAVMTLMGISGVLWQWSLTRQANRRLGSEISRARRELAEQHFRSGETPQALRVLAGHLRDQPTDIAAARRLWGAVARRGWPLPHLAIQVPELVASGLLHPDEERLLLLTAKSVDAKVFDFQIYDGRSGRRLAEPIPMAARVGNWGFSLDLLWFATLFEQEWRLWEGKSLRPVSAPVPGTLTTLDFGWHPDGKRVFFAEGSNVVLRPGIPQLPTEDPRSIQRFPLQTNVSAFSLDTDGRTLAAGDGLGTIKIWDIGSGALIAEIRAGRGPVTGVVVINSPGRVIGTFQRASSASRAVTGDWKRLTVLWELPSGQEIARFTNATVISVSPTTNQVVLRVDSDVHVIDVSRGARVGEWKNASSTGFTADGHYLGLVEGDNRFSWVEAAGLRSIGEPLRYAWPVELPAFASQTEKVLIPTSRGDVTVWNRPRTNASPAQLGNQAKRFAIHPVDLSLIVAQSNWVHWFDSSNRVKHSEALPSTVQALAIEPKGKWIAAGGDNGRVTLLDGRTFNRAQEWTVGTNGIYQLAFSPDGIRLAGGTLSGMLYQWSLAPGTSQALPFDLARNAPQTYRRHEIHAIRYHPSLPSLAVACGNGLLYMVNSGSTNVLYVLSHDDVPLFDVRFDASGARFAVASFRGYARVYDSSSGRPMTPKLFHDSSVLSVDFSPDGAYLLTASDDHNARVWNLKTGRLQSIAKGHDQTVFRAVFSPDGTRFVTSAADRSMRVWETMTGLPMDEPLSHASRSSTTVAWRGSDAIAVLAQGHPVLIYSLPELPTPVPGWVCDLAEFLSGSSTNQTPAPDLLRLRQSLSGQTSHGFWETWGRGFLAP